MCVCMHAWRCSIFSFLSSERLAGYHKLTILSQQPLLSNKMHVVSMWKEPCLGHLLYDQGSRMFTAAYGAVCVFTKLWWVWIPSRERTINISPVSRGPNAFSRQLWHVAMFILHLLHWAFSFELMPSPQTLGVLLNTFCTRELHCSVNSCPWKSNSCHQMMLSMQMTENKVWGCVSLPSTGQGAVWYCFV